MTSKGYPGNSSARTVQVRDHQYIQRSADVELLDHCQHGRPAFILHSPQMGKSSLLAHTIERLKASHHTTLIDLSQFPHPAREEDWFHQIVRILDSSLDLSTDLMSWWAKPTVFALPPHRRLMKLFVEVILPEMTKPLVLFIDEIEQIIDLSFRDHFFEWLTTLYESRESNDALSRITFVVCGVATPSQLISEDESLFFKWSHQVVLSDFTLQESLPLSEGLSLSTDDAKEMVTWVYRWTNGHPYLTQMLCQLIEAQHRTAWLETETDECIREFIVSPQGLREPNFQLVRTALTEPDANGISLIEPYLDLLQGKTENLKSNPATLEQLRLVGVLREDTDNKITIRNMLYQEAFPIEWANRHLRSPLAVTQPVSGITPQMQTPPIPAKQHSYVLAASLFLLGIGILMWFFRTPESTPVSVSSPQTVSVLIEPEPALSPSIEITKIPEQPEALTEALLKIQDLETAIAHNQQHSGDEVRSLINQRTQLENQLISKEGALSEMGHQLEILAAELHAQQDAHDQSIVKLETKNTTIIGELKSAINEIDTLKAENLKQSSISSSEIAKLMENRSQLEIQLETAKTELAIALEQARGLEIKLAQQQRIQSDNRRLASDQAKLRERLLLSESALNEARLTLKTNETSALKQAELARAKLARLQQERSDDQETLRSQQKAITAFKAHATKYETDLSEKEQAIQETRQKITGLKRQTDALHNTMSEKDQNLQNAQKTIHSLTSEIHELHERESQTNIRLSELEKNVVEQRKTTDRTLRAIEQERDELKTELKLAAQKLNTTKTEMVSLADQLAEVQRTFANSQSNIQTIQASSSEKRRHAENHIAALTQNNTELETKLRENKEAFQQAQQRIEKSEIILNNVSVIEERMRTLIEQRNNFLAERNETQKQLAKAQQHILSLEEGLSAVSPTEDSSSTDLSELSTADNSFPFYEENGSWKIDLSNITKIGGTEEIQSQGKSGKTEEDVILEFEKIIGDKNES